MKVAVLGMGGVGGFFGGKLAKAGISTLFVARGPHLQEIQKKGLQVKSIDGDFTAHPTQATDDLTACEDADLILFCTKTWQIDELAPQLKAILKPAAIILPLQNGADNEERLLQYFPKEQILGGLCRIISFVESPGVIHHPAFHPQIIFGELNNEKTKRVQAIKALFDQAEIDSIIADDIWRAIWQKFLFICTISGLGALTRSEIGVVRSNPFTRDLLIKTAQEIITVAQAKQINLLPADIDRMFEAIDSQNPNTTASMQRDIMEGKPSELEQFNGYIVKEGQRLAVSTPVNHMIYQLLLPQENQARSRNS